MISIKETKDVHQADIVEIYKANKWSSAEKPDQLFKALMNSHSFITRCGLLSPFKGL